MMNRSTPPAHSLRPPHLRVVDAAEVASDAALERAAHTVLGGDPVAALDRLRAAIAKGDDALFARVAEALVVASPYDAGLVARALASLQAMTADAARTTEARLRAKNRSLASTARRDSLTHISNRGTLDESLDAEVRRAERYGQPFSVLFVDIDRFKRINDTLGHAAGDAVLREVAATIRRALRPGDVLGRYGGEELVVGLVNADGRAALRAAERLRRDVERARLDQAAEGAHVTVSIGVATMAPGGLVPAGQLVDRADRAMLQAKASGRNAVCAWSPATRAP